MDKKNESTNEQVVKAIDHPSSNEPRNKKLFVEPEISTPVDVLEATTFLQIGGSGATN